MIASVAFLPTLAETERMLPRLPRVVVAVVLVRLCQGSRSHYHFSIAVSAAVEQITVVEEVLAQLIIRPNILTLQVGALIWRNDFKGDRDP